MIENIYYIIMLSIFFLVSFAYIMKRDILYGGIYFFLYVYVIFASIGYSYFPEVSMVIKAYFGPEIFPKFISFVILSFIFFFIVFYFLFPLVKKSKCYNVVYRPLMRNRMLFIGILLLHLFILSSFLMINFQELNYGTFADEDFQQSKGIFFTIFGISFKQSVSIILVLYIYYRTDKPKNNYIILESKNKLYFILLMIEIGQFIFISNKVGSRTDILALTLSIIVFEYQFLKYLNKKISFKQIIKFSIIGCIVLYGLTILEQNRTEHNIEQSFAYEKLLLQDYYAPAHILLGAIYYDFINPIEVTLSNVANSFIKIGYPFLQTTIADLFNPGASTRSASYAFYLFSEGYIFMGFMGFIYNGIILFLGISLWKKLTWSNNNAYNLFMGAIVAQRMVTCCRSQSSFFIKDLYIYFLPAIVLIYLITGLKPVIFKKKYESMDNKPLCNIANRAMERR